MAKQKLITRSQRTVLLFLTIFAAFLVVLPSRWTSRLVSLVQVLVPFQDVASASMSGTPSDGEAVSAQQFARLRVERDALQRASTAWAARVAELEEEVQVLTASRLWAGADQRIGATGSLIPAQVIAEDLLPWRSSRLVNTGSLQGVERGAPVTSATLDLETTEGMRTGLDVLLGEAYIGTVEQVGSHTARVKLLSDRSVEMKVQLARHDASGVTTHQTYYWLVGIGNGMMRISDVDRRDIQAGAIAVGDLVLSDSQRSQLPAPMIIGRVAAIDDDRKNPLLSILTVKAEVDSTQLRRVYVFDPDLPESR